MTPPSERRAIIELMALQALFRWPAIARELGVQAAYWRTLDAGRRLADAALTRVFVRSDGSIPITNTAAVAEVPLDWIRERFTANLFDPAQGRAWLEELCTIEHGQMLMRRVEEVFRGERYEEMGEQLASVLREYQRAVGSSGTGNVKTMREVALQYVSDELERRREGSETSAVAIGGTFPRLTRILRGGWHPGELTVIVAAGGVGKTSMGEYFRRLLAQRSIDSILFSGEMTNEQLAERYVHAECATSMNTTIETWRLIEAGDRLKASDAARRMWVYEDVFLNVDRMLAILERKREEVGAIGLAVYDNLGRVRKGRRDDRKEWEVTQEAAVDMMDLVRLSGVPGLLLAHMTTEAAAQTDTAWEPNLDIVRGGGKLANEVSNMIAVWRNPTGTFAKVLKSRMNGPAVGERLTLAYYPDTQSYAEVEG